MPNLSHSGFWVFLLVWNVLASADFTVLNRQEGGLVLSVRGPTSQSIEDAYAHASARYNVLPSLQEHKLASRGLRLPSTSFGGDFGYSVTINFASQGNAPFNLLVDTGSSLTWVFGTQIRTASTKGLSLYDAARSRLVAGKSAKMSYGGGGSIQGHVYQDTIRLAGAQSPQQVTVVSGQSGNGGLHASGLLALAINPTSANMDSSGIPRVHGNLIKQGLSNGVFAVDFNPDPAGKANGGGELVFGPNINKHGPVTWVPVWGLRYDWLVPSSQIRIGKQVIKRPWPTTVPQDLSFDKRDEVFRALIAGEYAEQYDKRGGSRDPPCIWMDTGTTLNLIDDATLLAIISKLPGARHESGGLFSVPCKKPADAPDAIWWELGGQWFPLYYRIGSLLWYARGDGYCNITLQSRGGSNGCDVFGAFFFHGVYTVFDDKNKRIGFAVK